MSLEVGILFDSTLCIGCKACSIACKQSHNLPGEPNPDELDAETFTIVKEKDGIFCRNFCRHCLEPACASACPVGALHKTSHGPVLYDSAKCIGCRYCIVACPYNIPRYQWSKQSPLVRKCDFCNELLAQGKEPACANVCPTGATKFGIREDLLAEARERLKSKPDAYFQHIFGEKEVGGSSVLIISAQHISEFGIPVPKITSPLPDLTASYLNKVPAIVAGGGLFLAGIWWLTRRKNQVKKDERQSEQKKNSRE